MGFGLPIGIHLEVSVLHFLLYQAFPGAPQISVLKTNSQNCNRLYSKVRIPQYVAHPEINRLNHCKCHSGIPISP
jgi:hypothetical protein